MRVSVRCRIPHLISWLLPSSRTDLAIADNLAVDHPPTPTPNMVASDHVHASKPYHLDVGEINTSSGSTWSTLLRHPSLVLCQYPIVLLLTSRLRRQRHIQFPGSSHGVLSSISLASLRVIRPVLQWPPCDFHDKLVKGRVCCSSENSQARTVKREQSSENSQASRPTRLGRSEKKLKRTHVWRLSETIAVVQCASVWGVRSVLLLLLELCRAVQDVFSTPYRCQLPNLAKFSLRSRMPIGIELPTSASSTAPQPSRPSDLLEAYETVLCLRVPNLAILFPSCPR